MNDDKMREEFEAWAKTEGLEIKTITFFSCGQHTHYLQPETETAFRAYQAGRKAEREAIQKEALQQLTDEAQELDMGY